MAHLSCSTYGSFLRFTARSKLIENDRKGSTAVEPGACEWVSEERRARIAGTTATRVRRGRTPRGRAVVQSSICSDRLSASSTSIPR